MEIRNHVQGSTYDRCKQKHLLSPPDTFFLARLYPPAQNMLYPDTQRSQRRKYIPHSSFPSHCCGKMLLPIIPVVRSWSRNTARTVMLSFPFPVPAGRPSGHDRAGGLHGPELFRRPGLASVGVSPDGFSPRRLHHLRALRGDYRVDECYHGAAIASFSVPPLGPDANRCLNCYL